MWVENEAKTTGKWAKVWPELHVHAPRGYFDLFSPYVITALLNAIDFAMNEAGRFTRGGARCISSIDPTGGKRIPERRGSGRTRGEGAENERVSGREPAAVGAVTEGRAPGCPGRKTQATNSPLNESRS